MLSAQDKRIKRVFDIAISSIGIMGSFWIMFPAWVVSSLETKSNGLFLQKRIGRHGKPFILFKIKTMKDIEGIDTTVTTSGDKRITKSGSFFRKTKIDELPQFFNVLFGSMSLVGYRPDVEGFADILEDKDRLMLDIAPGITGPASIKYKNEEELLEKKENPEQHNREVIWPDKVAINKIYMNNWSLAKDIKYIIKTITG